VPHHENSHKIQTKNPLAMYAFAPVGVSFESQEKGEKIILLLRAHVVTLVPNVLEIIFLILLPLLLPAILKALGINLFETMAARQVFWIYVAWYLFVFGFTFYKFIFWYFNVYLLTNERIVDFDFRGILHKETSYANLSQIQDVSPKVIGFFGTFFHFGNIYVQTAAAKPEFEFHHVARPDNVAKEILEQVRLEAGEPPGVIA